MKSRGHGLKNETKTKVEALGVRSDAGVRVGGAGGLAERR